MQQSWMSRSPETAWALPASKTDISALGTARSHGCACGGAKPVAVPFARVLCPACQLREQRDAVQQEFGSADTVPLWPNARGEFCSKKAFIATIKTAAQQLGLRIRTPAGAEAWGGHAFRRGGAQFLAAQGIDTWRIQALARHLSNASSLGPMRGEGLEPRTACGRGQGSTRCGCDFMSHVWFAS